MPSGGIIKAIKNYRLKQLKFLVDFGVKVDVTDDDGRHTLIVALHLEKAKQRRKIFKFLLSKGANFNAIENSTGLSVLLHVCKLGYVPEFRHLLNTGLGSINLCHHDNRGWGALHYAARSGSAEMVAILIEALRKYDLPVDVRTPEGLTPYLIARRLGYDDLAELIASKGNTSDTQQDLRLYRNNTLLKQVYKKRNIHKKRKSFLSQCNNDPNDNRLPKIADGMKREKIVSFSRQVDTGDNSFLPNAGHGQSLRWLLSELGEQLTPSYRPCVKQQPIQRQSNIETKQKSTSLMTLVHSMPTFTIRKWQRKAKGQKQRLKLPQSQLPAITDTVEPV